MEETIRVFARPGTPTSRQCPRVKMAAMICSMTSVWPTTTRRSCSIICERVCENCVRYSLMRSFVTTRLPSAADGGKARGTHHSMVHLPNLDTQHGDCRFTSELLARGT